MDIQQSTYAFAEIFGAMLVIAVLIALVVAITMPAQTHFAKSRAAKLVIQARNLLALGIYARDEQDNHGPAELLGEAYRLQRKFHLKADMIGLRDDAELDELINRAIRGRVPMTIVPASEMDTLPEMKVQVPDFSTQELEPTNPDLGVADRVANARAESARADRHDDDSEEYLKSCADMTAGLHTRINREDLN